MLNTTSLTTWLLGGWMTMFTVLAIVSLSMRASVTTTSLVIALGIAPGVVMAVLRRGAAPPTVAEILHAVETTDGRP